MVVRLAGIWDKSRCSVSPLYNFLGYTGELTPFVGERAGISQFIVEGKIFALPTKTLQADGRQLVINTNNRTYSFDYV